MVPWILWNSIIRNTWRISKCINKWIQRCHFALFLFIYSMEYSQTTIPLTSKVCLQVLNLSKILRNLLPRAAKHMHFFIQAPRMHCFGSNHLFPVDLRQAVNYEPNTAWHRAGSTAEVVTDGPIPSCVLGECSDHILLDFEKSTDMDQLPLYPLPSFCLHVFKKLVLDPYYL